MDKHEFQLREMLAADLEDLCALARCITEGAEPVLRLAPGPAALSGPLGRTGLRLAPWEPRLVGADPAAGPSLRPRSPVSGFASDLADAVLEIPGPDGAPMAVVEIGKVAPESFTPRRREALERLGRIMQRHLAALAFGPALVALPVLRLAHLMREFDDQAVSQGFSGLLQLLSGRNPSSVEATALRIGGLAEVPQECLCAREVRLSRTALDLLAAAGLGEPGVAAVAEAPGPDLPAGPPTGLAPFARLGLADSQFDIAEDAEGRLWFRQAKAAAEWSFLANDLENGWTAVAAEILSRTCDIMEAFAQMHAIHRRDLSVAGELEVYDLVDLSWSLRAAGDGFEARLGDGRWHGCDDLAALPMRERALAVLSRLVPDLDQRLSADAEAWASRMAHAVQVTPVIAAA